MAERRAALVDDQNVVINIGKVDDGLLPAEAGWVVLPEGMTVGIGWHRLGDGFVAPPRPLEEIRAERISALSGACRDAIVGDATTGAYESDALGSPHRYPNGATDQTNLLGSVMASMLDVPAGWTTSFWCRDGEGEWAMRPHDAEQIARVGLAAKGHVEACQTRLADLVAQVAGATDATAIASIEW